MQIVVIGALVIVWGRVIFRLYKNLKSDAVVNNIVNTKYEPVAEINLFDTFRIGANYRDPFLSKPRESHRNENSAVNPAPQALQAPPPPKEIKIINWPAISYFGYISDKATSKKLALATVNGVTHKIFTGTKIGDLTVTKIFKDSIEVILGKEHKVVKK